MKQLALRKIVSVRIKNFFVFIINKPIQSPGNAKGGPQKMGLEIRIIEVERGFKSD
jgi:hypothetical protein